MLFKTSKDRVAEIVSRDRSSRRFVVVLQAGGIMSQ